MCCPVLTDRRNQIQLFHFSLCSPLVFISHSPLNFPSCNKTFEWQWHSPNTSDRHSAPALLLCLSHPLSFPHVLLSEIDRKENKMTGFHITAVIPRDYTGKWLFPHTKGSITARWPLVIVFLNLRVRHPRIGTSVCVLAGVFVCVYVWLSDVIVSVPELLMQWGGIHPVIHPQVFFPHPLFAVMFAMTAWPSIFSRKTSSFKKKGARGSANYIFLCPLKHRCNYLGKKHPIGS